MLSKQTELNISKYSELYDILIPKDHELRRLTELVDFSFVYRELTDKYSLDMGRTAVDPIQMFKYLYLKVRYDLSDRDLVSRAKTDLALKFFIGLNPEDDVIHPSLLAKFRRQRLKDVDLLKLLIRETVTLAIEKQVLEKGTVIVDATHTVARYNQNSPVETLRNASRNLRRRLYQVDPSIKEKLPEKNRSNKLPDEQRYVDQLNNAVKLQPALLRQNGISEALHNLEEIQEDVKEYRKYSHDNDAKLGHKTQDTSFYGYKTHAAMSENGIITATVISSGEKGDGQYLPELIEISNENGMDVKEVIGDRAYSSWKNLKYTREHQVKLIARLNPIIANSQLSKRELWDYNKDAGLFVCPNGHLATRKTRKCYKKRIETPAMVYHFDIEKCKHCPLKDGCYRPGAKSKTYSIKLGRDEHRSQLIFEGTEYFNERIKTRYKIEGKNSELKNKHGYNQSWSNGISAMTLQGAITLFCVNLKRITKLIDEK